MLSGSVIMLSEEHPLKTPLPIDAMLSGNVIVLSEEHPSKTQLPSVVTVSDIMVV